jgi:phosphatidylserine/phosphatidylglycerophosphate/cardiolipin synthase-like enzyme
MLDTVGAFWRQESAPRVAVFVDAAAYFHAARAAMRRARRSVWLLNWAFEVETPIAPRRDQAPSETFADFLIALAADRPQLDVRLLCWDAALPVAMTQHFFPLEDRHAFARSAVKFRLDAKAPLGGCHHQKMIVIDGELAFCGGADIGPDRWDTPEHLDEDPRRLKPGHGRQFFDSRHEVMALVDGPPAATLATLFRDRWRRCTAEDLPPPRLPGPEAPLTDLWPPMCEPILRGVRVGVSRTLPAWRDEPGIREIEQLNLAAIAAARETIYMENQYFTSPVVGEALAERLEASDGPEVVLVSTRHSPSYFDQMTMDRTRARFIKHLTHADRHKRLQIYSPATAQGRIIIVHAKLAIIDDTLLRIGSANMNNRSTGFDSECDVTFEAIGPDAGLHRAAIASLRLRLVAHWLGCANEVVQEALLREGRLGAAIESLRATGLGRLAPITPPTLGPLAALIAALHLGDPVTPEDSFRPWRRPRQIRDDIRRLGRIDFRTK